jgi:hypothetical protein
VIGLASGRLVLDATPDQLSQAVARELFGVEEADEALAAPPAMPVPIPAFAQAASA